MDPLLPFDDLHFMGEALKQAKMAYKEGEVPIGAVVVSGNKIVGRGHNQVECLQDATAHAEMIAITAATQHLNSKYLEDCVVYVTVEPCPMCAYAMKWSQVKKVVYGAPEPKHGFSKYGLDLLHAKTEVISGVMQNETADLMISFFRDKRK